MRKLLCLIMLIGLLSFGSSALAQEVNRCTLPGGAPFAIHFEGRLTLVAMANETRLTIIQVDKDVTDPGKKLPSQDIGVFSVSYDKPGLLCDIHGVDSYETYKDNLTDDMGFIFMEMCTAK